MFRTVTLCVLVVGIGVSAVHTATVISVEVDRRYFFLLAFPTTGTISSSSILSPVTPIPPSSHVLSSVLHVYQCGVHLPRRHMAEDCSTCCPSVLPTSAPESRSLVPNSFFRVSGHRPACRRFSSVSSVRDYEHSTANRSLSMSIHCPP